MKKKSVATSHINPGLKRELVSDIDLSAKLIEDEGMPVEVGVGRLANRLDLAFKLADSAQSLSKLLLQLSDLFLCGVHPSTIKQGVTNEKK